MIEQMSNVQIQNRMGYHLTSKAGEIRLNPKHQPVLGASSEPKDLHHRRIGEEIHNLTTNSNQPRQVLVETKIREKKIVDNVAGFTSEQPKSFRHVHRVSEIQSEGTEQPRSPTSRRMDECTTHFDVTHAPEKVTDTEDPYPEDAEQELTHTTAPSPMQTLSNEVFPNKAYLMMIIDKYRAKCEEEAAAKVCRRLERLPPKFRKTKKAEVPGNTHGAASSLTTKQKRPRDRLTAIRPEPTDVLLGRGRGHTHHPGNQKYLQKIDEYGSEYNAAQTYAETIRITQEIVNYINESGRFLRFDKAKCQWFEVDQETARRKASQDLRNRRRPPRVSSKSVAADEAEEVEEQLQERLYSALPRDHASHEPFSALQFLRSQRLLQPARISARTEDIVLRHALGLMR